MVKSPEQSYILWFTQRVGSTLMAQALEDTGVAGRPREWLNAGSADEVLKKHRAATARELRDRLWREATTPNGVLGIKYGMVPHLHGELLELMASVEPEGPHRSHAAWKAFFPDCSHCLLLRRDKLRLAVSWWRAINSKQWHRPRPVPRTSVGMVESNPPGALIDKYDFHAIQHLLAECSAREEAIHSQLEEWAIEPLTIVYEDFIATYEATVRAVLGFLRIPHARTMTIAPPAFEALADEVNEAWYDRFRADRGRRRRR